MLDEQFQSPSTKKAVRAAAVPEGGVDLRWHYI
jgi:hypothetical protein